MQGCGLTETATSLDTIRREIEHLKIEKMNALSHQSKTLDDILEEIIDIKIGIIAKVGTLEKKSSEQIRARHKQLSDVLHSDISILDDMLKCTVEQIKTIDQYRDDNEAQLFVHVKTGQKLKSMWATLAKQVVSTTGTALSFQNNKQIETILNEVDSFGTISDNVNVHPYKVSFVDDFDVKVKGDRSICNIRDICCFGRKPVCYYRLYE